MARFRNACRRHLPGCLALGGAVTAALLWSWVIAGGEVPLDVFAGWRQIIIVVLLGVVLGGIVAEVTAVVAGCRPHEQPVGMILIAGTFMLPFYGFMLLASAMLQD